MVYVPIPSNKTSVENFRSYVTEWYTYDMKSNQLKRSGRNPSITTRSSYGSVSRSRGPMTRLASGSLWSPVRPYSRFAAVLTVLPGHARTTQTPVSEYTDWFGPVMQTPGFDPFSWVWLNFASNLLWVNDPTGWGNVSASTNMTNRLLTKLLTKAGRRQINYGESIAESRSTIKMICTSVISLANAYLLARKGRWGAAAKALGVPRPSDVSSASRAWLSMQYGWLPLMQDIYDTSNLLKRGLSSNSQLVSVSASVSGSDSWNGSKNGYKTSCQASVKMTGKMWYTVRKSHIDSLNQLGLLNPLEVAWAVVPFSFVVDWFLPVGSFLEALSARATVDFVDGYYNFKFQSEAEGTSGPGSFPNGTKIFDTNVVKGSASKFSRSKIASTPFPAPYIKSPFSSNHLVTAISLITSLRK